MNSTFLLNSKFLTPCISMSLVGEKPDATTPIFSRTRDIFKNILRPSASLIASRSPSLDPRLVLSGNFAPVDELPPTDCEVIGSLPACLEGVYFRNGPNPQYPPTHASNNYHLFDGDGMVHCVRISKGQPPTLCSRYVRTYKYNTEREAGFPIVPSIFSSFTDLTSSAIHATRYATRILTSQYDPTNGIGLANTSLAYFGNNLFALGESDLPYALLVTPDGDIQTCGRHDFNGKLLGNMTAHPKFDPHTGETFAFRYQPINRPFLTYFYFNANGNKQPDVPIHSLETPTFIHDFAITKKYAVFADIQLKIKPMKMMFGMGCPVSADLSKVPRIGIIPRYSTDGSEMTWFDAPGFNPIHMISAWDEDNGNAIVMVAPNILGVQHSLDRMDLVHASMEKVKIQLSTGKITRQPISTRNLDFAVINPAYVTKRNKYVYAAVGDPMPKFSGVVKLDLTKMRGGDCTVARRMYGGTGCYGGEPLFVAKDPENPTAEEDDGYVLSLAHNENTGESSLLVMDAKSVDLDLVAIVKLPRRVPYGFHGLFLREKTLKLAQNIVSHSSNLRT